MIAPPKVLLRSAHVAGRRVAWCVAAMAPLLAAGCGGGSTHVARSETSSTATVTINAGEHYQRIAGFGVSEGFGQAKALMNAPASVQKQVLSLLYSPDHGAGLTILRNEISADAGFTIEPKAPSSRPRPRRICHSPRSARIKGSCGSRRRSRPTMAPACSPTRGALPGS